MISTGCLMRIAISVMYATSASSAMRCSVISTPMEITCCPPPIGDLAGIPRDDLLLTGFCRDPGLKIRKVLLGRNHLFYLPGYGIPVILIRVEAFPDLMSADCLSPQISGNLLCCRVPHHYLAMRVKDRYQDIGIVDDALPEGIEFPETGDILPDGILPADTPSVLDLLGVPENDTGCSRNGCGSWSQNFQNNPLLQEFLQFCR